MLPSFQACSAPSCPAASLSIHSTILSNRSKVGSSSTGRERQPLGSEIAGSPVAYTGVRACVQEKRPSDVLVGRRGDGLYYSRPGGG